MPTEPPGHQAGRSSGVLNLSSPGRTWLFPARIRNQSRRPSKPTRGRIANGHEHVEQLNNEILGVALASLTISACQPQEPVALAPAAPPSALQECAATYLDATGLAARCAQLEVIGTGYNFTEGPA